MIIGHITTSWTTQTGWHDSIQQVSCTLTADGHKVARRRLLPWVVIALPDGATVFGLLRGGSYFHPEMTLGPSGYRRAHATIPADAPLRTMTAADHGRLAAFEERCRAAERHGGAVPYEDARGFSA